MLIMKIIEIGHLRSAPPAIYKRLHEQVVVFLKMGYTEAELGILIQPITNNRCFEEIDQVIPKSFME